MIYVVQAEEHELSYDLLQQLAAILQESPDVTHADATYRLHHSQGILAFEDQAEANRVCQRFNTIGVPAFLLDTLLPLAVTRPLNRDTPEVDGEIQLAVAGRVNFVAKDKTWNYSPWRTRMVYSFFNGGIVIPDSGFEENTTEREKISFIIDLFTPTTHWRAHAGNLLVLQPVVELLRSSSALLSLGIRNLLNDDKRLPIFRSEDDYGKYVTWLYQVRYANPDMMW